MENPKAFISLLAMELMLIAMCWGIEEIANVLQEPLSMRKDKLVTGLRTSLLATVKCHLLHFLLLKNMTTVIVNRVEKRNLINMKRKKDKNMTTKILILFLIK